MKRSTSLLGAAGLAVLVAACGGETPTGVGSATQAPIIAGVGQPLAPTAGPSFDHVAGSTTSQHVTAVRISNTATNNVRVIWHQAAGANKYNVQLCATSACNATIQSVNVDGQPWTEGTITSGHLSHDLTVTVPSSSTTYYVRVKANGNPDISSFGDWVTVSFSLGATAVNHAPEAKIVVSGALNEGSSISFDGSGSTDADGDALTYSWNFGDGSTATGATVTHVYKDDDDYVATLTVSDGKGGSNTSSVDVHVHNVAPTATLGATSPVAEGASITVSLSGAADVSEIDQAAGFTYAFDCGAGYSAWGTGASATCTALDNPSHLVKAMIRDKDLDSREYTATVTVTNVAPTATFNAPVSVDEGSAISLSLTDAQDVAADLPGLTYAFDCGSGYGSANSASTAS